MNGAMIAEKGITFYVLLLVRFQKLLPVSIQI